MNIGKEDKRPKGFTANQDFYAELADHYDDMARFAERLESEQKVLSLWQKKLACQTVVDVGCGTGLHAVVLARLGMQVTAIDPSAAMLQRAAENAKANAVSLTLLPITMQKLGRSIKTEQDAVFCLGNTLPHILTIRSLQASLKSVYKTLKPGGALVIQILNYEHVLRQQQRIVQISRSGDSEYIRFYDFLGKRLRFNVLMIKGSTPPFRRQLLSTMLRPLSQPLLKSILHQCGFVALEFFANLSQAPFAVDTSPNLVICCYKK
jgi:glycine/sarcosine N-methyltransferase